VIAFRRVRSGGFDVVPRLFTARLSALAAAEATPGVEDGAHQGAQGRGEAVEILASTLELARKHASPKHPVFQETITNLIACYEELDRRTEAEALRRELAQLPAPAEKPAARSLPPIASPIPRPAPKP
jgi:hypothetical protein